MAFIIAVLVTNLAASAIGPADARSILSKWRTPASIVALVPTKKLATNPSRKQRKDEWHSGLPVETPPPEAGRIYEIDTSADPRKAWRCLQVRDSKIRDAGLGLFATCDIKNETLLGEYCGKRFLMGEVGANKLLTADKAYVWKVPRCLAPKNRLVVIKREDKLKARQCSGQNGYVYVDAAPMADPMTNPLRYVNGVMKSKAAEPLRANVEAFFADDRVFYYSTRAILKGEEFLVDYGSTYWNDPRSTDGGATSEGLELDWNNFMTDG